MKIFSLVSTLIALGLVAPAHAAYAFDLDSMMDAAKNGNGTYVETHSSASTGGQTSQGGENMQTNDASASSYTEINAGEDGGMVKVKIETTENGKTKTNEYTHEIPKSEGVKVEANAESKDGESSAEVKVNDEVVDTKVSEGHETATSTVVGFFTETIPGLFKKALTFLGL